MDAGVIAPETKPSEAMVMFGDSLNLAVLARLVAKPKIGSTKENVTHSHKLTPSSGEHKCLVGS